MYFRQKSVKSENTECIVGIVVVIGRETIISSKPYCLCSRQPHNRYNSAGKIISSRPSPAKVLTTILLVGCKNICRIQLNR